MRATTLLIGLLSLIASDLSMGTVAQEETPRSKTEHVQKLQGEYKTLSRIDGTYSKNETVKDVCNRLFKVAHKNKINLRDALSEGDEELKDFQNNLQKCYE